MYVELLVLEHDFFVSFSVRYPDTKPNSSRDVLNCMRENYQFRFLSNFGKVAVILSIIQATSSSAERSFSVLQKLKTYLESSSYQGCKISHLTATEQKLKK